MCAGRLREATQLLATRARVSCGARTGDAGCERAERKLLCPTEQTTTRGGAEAGLVRTRFETRLRRASAHQDAGMAQLQAAACIG
jgi:hypothetical protein